MSTGPIAPQPQPPKPASSDTNTMGLIGLIMGILGFLTWVTAPVGLVLSYMGMKHPQNGIAIAGLIVSIVSTIYAVICVTIIVVWFGVVAAYFAAICGCCMCMGFQATSDLALQNEVRQSVAEELEKQSFEISLHNFSANPPMASDAKTFSGTAVYTDENFNQMAIDFTGDADKVDGNWQVNNLDLTGEPYEWDPFPSNDGAFDEAFDDAPIDGEMSDGEEVPMDGAFDGETGDGEAIDTAAPDGDAFDGEAVDDAFPAVDDPFAEPVPN